MVRYRSGALRATAAVAKSARTFCAQRDGPPRRLKNSLTHSTREKPAKASFILSEFWLIPPDPA